MKSFSVIVIAKNEEAYLPHCLQSVLRAVARIGRAEIVLVDSASTDRTVEIALSYGVRVISLRPDWPLSPAAGRYAGFHHTSGELIMFVDGDTIIDDEWLSRATAWFEQTDVAGVMGFFDDVDEDGRPLPYVGKRSPVVTRINELRGNGLYRRAAMNQVGTFNPYLTTEEEAELGLRLRSAGWRLLQLPIPMSCHRRGAPALTEIYRAFRLGRVEGLGLTFRYACRQGLGLRFCCDRLRPTMLFALICLLLSPGLWLMASGYQKTANIFSALLSVWMCSVAIKKRSLAGPLAYITIHLTTLFGLLTGGLIKQIKNPHDYPLDVIEKNRQD